ncbi:hypothetical protein POPTR_004G030100v4 [Populus trichocarpa]|uniref:Uncharacterized protein n=2 Tax=Populus trichocarpa TaxID=3694 RepID=A0ACC0T2K1_POPTR|nr:uncharacterized protein LOC7494316 [Populus trichocarpa]XP_024455680.2 uncharacterized protein LOC7494316 [Populus trichocarpa]KAI9395788.1 hypothetical protein POPTR_004G030100v4 [Populus trichocarpa]KAI9395789.1 hypothetical protein POPTR_004G030100v4 [Populus trichocarpa]
MATALSWQPQLPTRIHKHSHPSSFIDAGTGYAFQCRIHRPISSIHSGKALAFRRDFDRFAKDAWRTANDGFEQFLFEAKKTAERIDRRYSVSRRLSAVAQSASDRAREIDREYDISIRWRTFSMDFNRNWPRYRKQINDFFNTPIGRSFVTIFFLWFALSGWMFRLFIIATWVLPIAGPLLIGTLANNLVIKGACPACKRQFVGYKNQVIRCGGCGNIVWQPKGGFPGRGPGDFFSGGGRGTRSSKSDPEIIDVDFEEKS